jgi:uncharacterized protein (UPF0333 family)
MKKGQGALEYLIIIAAVIGVAAVVVAFIYPMIFENQEVAKRNSQKNICAQNGITISNYNEYPKDADEAKTIIDVEYGGSRVGCDSGDTDIQYDTRCNIGDEDVQEIQVQVNKTHCRFKNI